MKWNYKSFNLIKDKDKVIEARLNDEKRKLLRIGDVIEFTNTKTVKKINVKVVELLHHNIFEKLLDSLDISEFGSNNKKILLCEFDENYTKEKIKQYGVLGIRIEKVD